MRTQGNGWAVLGIDLGATNIKAAVFDETGQAHGQTQVPSEVGQGPLPAMQRVAELVERGRQGAKAAGLVVRAVGIGVCGPVRHADGILVESSVLPGWHEVPVAALVSRAVGLPVHLENDANAAILGEWWQGAGRQRSVVAGITLGTGVGGGLVVNGQVYRGATGFGAEFGHIQVAAGPGCPCGGTGCLGRVASATATVERYAQTVGNPQACPDGVRELAQKAASGDHAAQEAIATSAAHIARAALTLANCLNPDVFVLAGGMAMLGEPLLSPIRSLLATSTYAGIGRSIEVSCACLGMYSGCYGAAWLALSGGKCLPA